MDLVQREIGPAPPIVALADDSPSAVLQEIFFHDLLNTLSSLHGYLQVWHALPEEARRALVPDMQRLAQRAVDEVQAQRDLVRAEAGDSHVAARPVDVRRVLSEVCLGFQPEADEQDRLRLDVPRLDLPVVTDPVLLRRVVGNLIKNALEASGPGESVSVRWFPVQRRITVHNQAVMPDDVRAQVFQRAFSTKGAGRGIGTHSIRLLTERYLGGQVDFTSVAGRGTTFRVTLPEAPPVRDSPQVAVAVRERSPD